MRWWNGGELGRVACLIDGDLVRRGELSRGLGFSTADRRENVRRVASLAARLAPEIDVVVAMVSPTEQIREPARTLPELVMVGLHGPPDVARQRDFKGVYRRTGTPPPTSRPIPRPPSSTPAAPAWRGAWNRSWTHRRTTRSPVFPQDVEPAVQFNQSVEPASCRRHIT